MPARFHHTLLARVRTELGLTQDAAAAAVGVDVRTYRRYESGAVNDPAADFTVRNASRRRLLARISDEFGVPLADLIVDAPAAARWSTCHAHTLPRAPHFVGRDDTLARLDAWSHARGCLALVAVGGAGKTAVVERWLTRRGDGPHPAGCLVWSFYDDTRVEALLGRAHAYFAPGAAAPDSDSERLAALQTALADGPDHLLVLDGLEVVQSTSGRIDDPTLRRLLLAVARGLGRAKVLLTTRLAPTDLTPYEPDGLLLIPLGDLSHHEGRALLARWGLGDSPDLQRLSERVGGHALSVAMLGSYAGAFLGGDSSLAAAIDLEPAARDDLQARKLLSVLTAYARALSPVERDLLARLAVFPAGADTSLLARLAAADPAIAGHLAGLDETTLAPLLARLHRLGLVARTARHQFAAHPFVAEFFRSLLSAPAAALHEVERRHLLSRLDTHALGPHTTDLLDTYESLLVHTLRAGHPAAAMTIYTRSLGGFDHLGLRLGAMTRGARILRHFNNFNFDERDPTRLDPGRRARLVYDEALYHIALGDLPHALACLAAHTTLVRGLGSLVGLTTSLRTRAYAVRLTGALTSALELADAAIDVATRAASPADLARGLALAARVHHDLGRRSLSARHFARSRAVDGRPFARRALWYAEHLLDLGDTAGALAEIQSTLPGLQTLGWAGHCAHAHTLLGLAALPADLAQARAHLDAARTWTATSGEVEVQLRCHELAATIDLHTRPIPTAPDLGRTLADTCGFTLFATRLTNLALARSLARPTPAGSPAAHTALTLTALTTARARPDDAWGLADALHLAGLATGDRVHLQAAAELRAAIDHPGLAATREALAALQP